MDPERIAQWWGCVPQFGVGVSCGPAGLVVIDVDAHHRALPTRDRVLPGIPIADEVDLSGLATGFHTLGVLAALRRATSPADDETTLRVRTPSGGMHVWYREENGRKWQCSSGASNARALAWQVDVRAHGGYIVAPGTATAAGTYTAVGPVRTPAPLPHWLAQELERTGHLPAAPEPSTRTVPARPQQAILAAGGDSPKTRRTLETVLAEVAACASVPEGAGFTERLNRAAYTAGGLIAAGYLAQEEAEQVLRETAAVARPGQEQRAATIIRSGLKAGLRRPLRLGGGR